MDLVLPAHTRVVYRHDGGSATEVVGEDTDFHGTLDQAVWGRKSGRAR